MNHAAMRVALSAVADSMRVDQIRRHDGACIVFAGVTDPVGRDTHKQNPDRALASAPRGS
jgi:hypothetical protein